MIDILHKLGLPINMSVQGAAIDEINAIVHWLMLVLFIGWGIFFIVSLVKFRASKNAKAPPPKELFRRLPEFSRPGAEILPQVLGLGTHSALSCTAPFPALHPFLRWSSFWLLSFVSGELVEFWEWFLSLH